MAESNDLTILKGRTPLDNNESGKDENDEI